MSTHATPPFAHCQMYPQPSTSVADKNLCNEIREIASRAYHEIDHTAAEGQRLQDIQRGRYGFRTLDQLLEIVSRNDALSEMLIGIITRRVRRLPSTIPCLSTAFDEETVAQGEADIAQRTAERAPCRTTLGHVRGKLIRQRFTLDRAIEAVDMTMAQIMATRHFQ